MTTPRALSRRSAPPPGAITRVWPADALVRASSSPEERIVEGIAVPFGVVATVQDSPNGPRYRETIDRSALEGVDASTVLIDYLTEPPAGYNTHDGSRLVGRGVAGEVSDAGWRIAGRIARTSSGDEALELARAGVLTDMSVNFTPRSEVTRADGVVVRTGIDVHRVTLVPRGAYPGAQVTAVRAASEGSMHCSHCGAALVAGVGHSCDGTRASVRPSRAAAPAAAVDPPADDELEDDAPATPVAGDRRPNRTRVTVDVERAATDQLRAELERRDAGLADRSRAAAERSVVDGLARRSPITITRPEFTYGPGSGRSFFGDAFRASMLGGGDPDARDRVSRHYALLDDVDRAIQRSVVGGRSMARAGDVLSSEIPGAYPNDYLPGLIVNRVLKQRPMGGFYQRFPIEDGRPRIYPVNSVQTTVAAQGAEGANPAASDYATTATTITPTFYGGETKVSRQVLDGADPNTDVMIQTDLDEAYMQASEAVIRAAVEAGSTASGVTLTAATPDAGLRALVLNYLGNVYLPAERLFLPTTLALSWINQNDTTGRPLAPQVGAFNADGTLNVGELPIIGTELGVSVAQSWSSTAGAGAGVGGVAVIGRSPDFAILESNVASFRFDQGAEAPSAVRIGLWAYLTVGTRRGSRKATGA